jgi:predicted RNA-binding Zn-ribbon protein involved in translation (DUF1610 family)
MTVRQRAYAAIFLFLIFFFAIPMVVMTLRLPQWLAAVSMIGAALIYAFWALTFSCPKCGTQLLWEVRDHVKVGRLVPASQCPKCGSSTDR